MTNNAIANELRVDHLFLLVGTNPVPNWVAARLLLNEQGSLYLVHSKDTLRTAQRLAKHLMDKYSYQQPKYIEIADAYNAQDIYSKIKYKLDEIKQGTIGLNYTGGTKTMAAHSYQAMDKIGKGLAPVIFSYLEATTCTMRFDHGAQYKVGLAADAKLSLTELFELHDDFTFNTPSPIIQDDPRTKILFNALLNIHTSATYHEAWRNYCDTNFRYQEGKKKGQLKAKNDAKEIQLKLPEDLIAIAEALIPDGASGDKTLNDVINSKLWGFRDAEKLMKWLDGVWLEHYVNQHLIDQQNIYRIDDYNSNIEAYLKHFNNYKFEIDVAAIRGYQLHLISCFTGFKDKPKSKQKLFEAHIRAKQLGGDQSRAALVCCYDDALAIEREVAQDWDLKDHVKVFGRNDLLNLGEQLKVWFDAGAQEE